MQLILAIDSDLRRSEQLAALVRARLQVDLVQATSAGEGLHALRDRVPDLILTSPLLSPFDDGVLDEYLRDLGSAATHVQTLRIPMLSSGPKKKSAATRLFSLGRKKTQTSSASPDGCDPKVFADEIAHYLTRSLEDRSASANAASPYVQERTPAQPAPIVDVAFASRESAPEDWGARDTLVQELRTTAPSSWAEPEEEPAPVDADTHVPGSIFDLRIPMAHPPVSERAMDPEPVDVAYVERFDLAHDEPVELAHGTAAFIEPDPIVDAEPMTPVSVEPMAVDDAQGASVDQDLAASFGTGPAPIAVRLEPAPRVATREAAPRVAAQPMSPASQTPQPAPGNSASFEAALAAIRAAWTKPASPAPSTAGAGSPSGGRNSLAGSGDVDLTDSLERIRGTKQPETPRGHRGGDGAGGRGDWGVFDPSQYELSALVNKLDEITDSDETSARTNRATNRR